MAKNAKKAVKKPTTKELGTRYGYTSVLREYEKEEQRLDEIPLTDYRKMRTNDGKVSALEALYTLPIWRMAYNIDPAEGDKGEAEFVKDNFSQPFSNGGTERPFDYYIRDMVYFIFDGFRVYEKVWYVDKGKVRLKKLALRDASTVTIVSDKDELKAVKQENVEIPKEKVFLLTYKPSEDMFYGQSILRPVWYHWDKKHKLYYIAHVAAEVQTVPPRILKHKGMDKSQLSSLENALDRLGLESRITYNSNNAEVEFLDVTSGAKVSIMDLIAHHDNQMAKAMLAMWVDLSSEGNAAGSRALGSPMIDIYEQNIESITQIIESEINANLIPQLIDWNFASGRYPKFRFSPLDQQSEGLIRQSFMEIVKKGLPDELAMDIVGKIAKRFDIEFDAEEQLKIMEKKKAEQQKQFAQNEQLKTATRGFYKDPNQKGMQNNVNLEQKKKLNKFSEQDIINLVDEMDETGSRVNLMDLADKIEGAVNRLNQSLTSMVNDFSEDLLLIFVNAILNGDYDALNNIGLPNEQYQAAINLVLKDLYNYSKLKASEEIGIKTPATPEDALKKILLNTKNIVDKQFTELIAALVGLAIVGIDKGWDRNKAELSFGTILNEFKREKLQLGNEQMVVETFNDARNNVFKSNPGIVVAYRYNNRLENILRGVVCEYCQSLHGLTIPFNSPLFNEYKPPQHFRCACFWEAVRAGDDYELSPLPSLPVYDTISDFRGLSEHPAKVAVPVEKADPELTELVKQLLDE